MHTFFVDSGSLEALLVSLVASENAREAAVTPADAQRVLALLARPDAKKSPKKQARQIGQLPGDGQDLAE